MNRMNILWRSGGSSHILFLFYFLLPFFSPPMSSSLPSFLFFSRLFTFFIYSIQSLFSITLHHVCSVLFLLLKKVLVSKILFSMQPSASLFFFFPHFSLVCCTFLPFSIAVSLSCTSYVLTHFFALSLLISLYLCLTHFISLPLSHSS